MSIVTMLIAECFLHGESYLYVFYDNETLDLLRFEVKGNTKCKLTILLAEDDLKEEINEIGIKEQGDNIQIIKPTQKWKMVRVIEGKKETIKLPLSIRIKLNWEVI